MNPHDKESNNRERGLPPPPAPQQQQQSPTSSSSIDSVKSQSSKGLSTTSPTICSGCKEGIYERFLLKAMDEYWHEDCLKCSCCDCRLGEVGSTLYTRANLILCKRDYLRLFGSTGTCSACRKTIPAFEMVMRAKSYNYHLECFACQRCNHRFCVGDKFYLLDNRVLCEYDYEEEVSQRNMSQSSGPTGPPLQPNCSASPMTSVAGGVAGNHHQGNLHGMHGPIPPNLLHHQDFPPPPGQYRHPGQPVMYPASQSPDQQSQHYSQDMPHPPPLSSHQNGLRVNCNNNNWCTSLEELKKQTESLKTEIIH